MPDNIETTIYKLVLDESNYVRGVDRAVASTDKLSIAQEESNKKLKANQEALAKSATDIARFRQEADSYTGKSARDKQLLDKRVKDEEAYQQLLRAELEKTKAEYDRVTKAIETIAAASARFSSLKAPLSPIPVPQPVVPQQGVPIPAGGAGSELNSLLTQIQNFNPEELANISGDAMNEFRESVEAAEAALKLLTEAGAEGSEEFETLSKAVEASRLVLEQYDDLTKDTTKSTQSYRTQITNLNKELQVLEANGQAETDLYRQKQTQLVELTKKYKDQREIIRILASDTRALDFGKAAITAATSAFSALTSVQVLAGDQSEELQKKTLKLFAAMQLLTSIETLHNQVKKTGVLNTNLQSIAQSTYTAVVGASTGALKAFRVALLTTGVGAIVVGIGYLIAKLIEFNEQTEKAAETQKILNEVNEEAIRGYSGEVAKLDLIKAKLNDLTIPQKKRIELAKQYNQTAEEANKIDIEAIDNTNELNAAIDRQITLIEKRAKARAFENILTKRAEAVFLAEESARTKAEDVIGGAPPPITAEEFKTQADLKRLPEIQAGNVVPMLNAKTGKIENVTLTEADVEKLRQQQTDFHNKVVDNNRKAWIDRQVEIDENVVNARAAYEKAKGLATSIVNIDELLNPEKDKKEKEPPKNEFQKELAALIARRKQFATELLEGEARIISEFANKLEIEINRLRGLLSDKKLTREQFTILSKGAIDQNKAELDKALSDFGKLVKEKQEQIDREIRDLQLKNINDRIALIQDEFDRRRAALEQGEANELELQKRANADRLEALDKQKGILDESFYYVERAKIVEEGEKEITNITVRYAQERQQLSNDIFIDSLEQFEDAFEDLKLISNKNLLEEVQQLSTRFNTGKITYEQYKKDLQAIQKKYERQQLNDSINTLEGELRVLRRRLNNTLDTTSAHYEQLASLIRQKEAELVKARTSQTIVDQPAEAKPAERIQEYAQAIGELANAVTQFWVESNRAEQEALERSIALQERRVTEAQKIAERGNASYLKMEEDRLKQLQIARENAARREIAINAAVQASNLLVGITGAISKIATPGVGIAEVIASAAVIVSTLAAGFAMVRSLQNNQPKFAKGEKYVKRQRGEPAGVDTVSAMLTEGEAVITKEKNKAYHPVIEAIHDGTVPADFLNQQVEHYHKIKDAPKPNYEKIKDTATLSIGMDGKLQSLITEQNRKIDENNDLQRMTLQAMKNLSIDAKIDRDGVSIMIHEYMKKLERDKFT